MKHLSIREYIPVLLYTIMGVLIGIIVGAVDAIFGRVLLGITAFRGEHVTVLVPFWRLPVWQFYYYIKNQPEIAKGNGAHFRNRF